jgi:hypothetical protein
LALRSSLTHREAKESLPSSYYTGPSEDRLLPLRLVVAVVVNEFDDNEMRELADRDIRLL